LVKGNPKYFAVKIDLIQKIPKLDLNNINHKRKEFIQHEFEYKDGGYLYMRETKNFQTRSNGMMDMPIRSITRGMDPHGRVA
jgi:hypothetical protein